MADNNKCPLLKKISQNTIRQRKLTDSIRCELYIARTRPPVNW